MQKKEYSLSVGGRTLIAEFNDLAENANGSVIIRSGNTSVLVTAVMGDDPKDMPFFPLTVDYEERFYAAGAILGSRFMRREGRPSDEAILSARIIDRTIRPLFDERIRHDIQIVITVLSLGEDDPDMLAVVGASLALSVSDIPWNGPVGAIRIGLEEGKTELLKNPSYSMRASEHFETDVVACGKEGTINMIEVSGKETPEENVIKVLEEALKDITALEEWQKKIVKELGKEKRSLSFKEPLPETKKLFESELKQKLSGAVLSGTPGKKSIEGLKKEWLALVAEKIPDEERGLAEGVYEEAVNDVLHSEAIENGKRADGRGMDEVRPLFAQAGKISEILHGSGIFYRGGTHILSVLTLGGPGDSQLVDTMEFQEAKKRFMHHYNFPPFSVGETGRMGGMNRRMIGHGALAEKALLPVLPSTDTFPYTIRIVSEALASNGSTSMGSVCASSLALMDAGVPIQAPVAGIASGLMLSPNFKKDGKFKVLTDIQGPEDHHGDMDFKVAGTRAGVTAVQMDVKVDGVPLSILTEAFAKAKEARFKILDTIEQEIAAPREKLSPNAPEIIIIKIKPDQIGMVIGSGGKVINEIREQSGVEDITIEDDGSVFITGKNGSAAAAKKTIEEITKEYKPGERYEGEVVSIVDFGAFVRIGNAEGLVHVSEIASFRVEKVSDVLKIGEKVPVVVKEVDDRGRIKLSIKQADPSFIKQTKQRPNTTPPNNHGRSPSQE